MKYLSLLFCLSIFVACQNSTGDTKVSVDPEPASEAPAMDREEHLNKMEAIADTMKARATGPIDRALAKELISLSKSYGNAYPRDNENTPRLYFRAAEVARGIRQDDEAIKLFGLIYTNYPDHVKAPAAMFLQAFAYEDGIQDKEKAKATYHALIEKYPQSPLAEQARQLLSVIDKTPEEMVKEFQERNKKEEGYE